ncbi:hypothetical protein QF023_002689 [Chryseobacterium sp. SLBN-27]|uniref:DUF4296 domain-containing protein n=1 Tax=Chryseobacterium sp. SLBN-27 TaxID=3042287 RepID=UPI00285F68C2|nr:DUF4296 domain-containing protein [Chryseobacterium sp. SLBN-27]MDR6159173.1 hypothetical protein [Chryseobacterium sp. SLBN-27]
MEINHQQIMKRSMTNSSNIGECINAKFRKIIKNKKKLMKKMLFLFMLIFLFSCKDYIDKPENLVPQDKMAEIMADLAINDQATFMYPNSNLEAGTRYVLKTHNVKSTDYIESFKYYVVKEKMNAIVENAQEILLKKDPKAEKYVKDKKSKTGNTDNLPLLSR